MTSSERVLEKIPIERSPDGASDDLGPVHRSIYDSESKMTLPWSSTLGPVNVPLDQQTTASLTGQVLSQS
jgi:hypothetical protein